jgi:hypothetical protein
MPMAIPHLRPWPKLSSMRQAVCVDVFFVVLAVALCAALFYVGYRIEPHYASKDGHRFLSTGRWISAHGDPEGRKREVLIIVLPDHSLQMKAKRGIRRTVSYWSVEGKADEPPPRRAVYVLCSRTPAGTTHRMTIQLPSKSRAVAVLDEALAKTR